MKQHRLKPIATRCAILALGVCMVAPLAAIAQTGGGDQNNFFRKIPATRQAPQQVQVTAYKMGYEPSPADDISQAYSLQRSPKSRGMRALLPQRLDLRLTGYLPPISMQAKNDCVAWSTAYYAYTFSVAQRQQRSETAMQDEKFIFSPQYLYPHINMGKDQGAYISAAMNWLVDHGCATLAEAPYDTKDFKTPPSSAAEDRAKSYRAREAVCMANFRDKQFDPEMAKEFMASTNQPFVAGVKLFKDFPGFEKAASVKVAPDFVYNLSIEPTRDNTVGNHAMAFVGYDSVKKAFLVANSWSTEWGANGYLWINEDYLRKAIGEAWGFVPGGWKGRSVGPIDISNTLVAIPPKVKK